MGNRKRALKAANAISKVESASSPKRAEQIDEIYVESIKDLDYGEDE